MGKAAVMSNKKSPSKSEILASISEATSVAKKDVAAGVTPAPAPTPEGN